MEQRRRLVRPARLTLPGKIHPADRRLHRLVEIDVGKDHHRILAAKLERDVLDAGFGGGALDRATGRHRADEGDPLDARMPHQRVAGVGAVAGDDVDDSLGKHLGADFGQDGRRQRALFRRLDHHGVAGHQRRREAAGGEHDRMIERRDAADHAVRLADCQMQVLLAMPGSSRP